MKTLVFIFAAVFMLQISNTQATPNTGNDSPVSITDEIEDGVKEVVATVLGISVTDLKPITMIPLDKREAVAAKLTEKFALKQPIDAVDAKKLKNVQDCIAMVRQKKAGTFGAPKVSRKK